MVNAQHMRSYANYVDACFIMVAFAFPFFASKLILFWYSVASIKSVQTALQYKQKLDFPIFSIVTGKAKTGFGGLLYDALDAPF